MLKNLENEFHDWFVDATRIANEIGSEISMPRIAGRQIYRGNALADGATTEDYFRANVAIPFVDHLEQQLLARFDVESRVGKDLFALVPSLIVKEDKILELQKKLLFWEIDLPSPSSLLSELKLWKQFWVQKAELGSIPDNLASCRFAADEDVYPNICSLINVACTLPISSCEAERSFSGLRRIRTYLRSSMTTDRLAGLALMHLHNDMNIDVEKICEVFISKNNRRMYY